MRGSQIILVLPRGTVARGTVARDTYELLIFMLNPPQLQGPSWLINRVISRLTVV